MLYEYLQTLRKELDKAELMHVKIVAPDAPHINDWKISVDILKDAELAAAVEFIGYVVVLVLDVLHLLY